MHTERHTHTETVQVYDRTNVVSDGIKLLGYFFFSYRVFRVLRRQDPFRGIEFFLTSCMYVFGFI